MLLNLLTQKLNISVLHQCRLELICHLNFIRQVVCFLNFRQATMEEEEEYFQPILSSQEDDNFQKLNTVPIVSIPFLLGVGISCCVVLSLGSLSV